MLCYVHTAAAARSAESTSTLTLAPANNFSQRRFLALSLQKSENFSFLAHHALNVDAWNLYIPPTIGLKRNSRDYSKSRLEMRESCGALASARRPLHPPLGVFLSNRTQMLIRLGCSPLCLSCCCRRCCCSCPSAFRSRFPVQYRATFFFYISWAKYSPQEWRSALNRPDPSPSPPPRSVSGCCL